MRMTCKKASNISEPCVLENNVHAIHHITDFQVNGPVRPAREVERDALGYGVGHPKLWQRSRGSRDCSQGYKLYLKLCATSRPLNPTAIIVLTETNLLR